MGLDEMVCNLNVDRSLVESMHHGVAHILYAMLACLLLEARAVKEYWSNTRMDLEEFMTLNLAKSHRNFTIHLSTGSSSDNLSELATGSALRVSTQHLDVASAWGP
jgi:hypothetical protein